MRDFLDDLDRRLMAAANEQAAEAAEQARPRRSRRRPVLLGGLTATIAAAVAGFTMVGTSVAELPILSTPTVDASKVRDAAPAAARRGVDFTKGHAFGTPGGPGYVVTNERNGTVCLMVPDPNPEAAGSYGVTCGQPLAKVERDGLYTEFVGDRSVTADAATDGVFVLPDHAEDVRLVTGGRATAPKLESGVLVVHVTEDSRITWTVKGRPASKDVAGPFGGELGATMASCPDGRSVTVRLPKSVQPNTPEASQALGKAIKKACARP